MTRQTHTHATLGVHPDVFDSIRSRLIAAGYPVLHDGYVDMQGVALAPDYSEASGSQLQVNQLTAGLVEAKAALEFAVAGAKARYPASYQCTAVYTGLGIVDAILKDWGSDVKAEHEKGDDSMVLVPRQLLSAAAGALFAIPETNPTSKHLIDNLRKYTVGTACGEGVAS